MTTIIYKHIRHGYAKIDDQGILVISIPNRLKNNESFKNALLQKGELLLSRYKKKTHIQTSDKESVLLFGERVPLTDLYKQHHKTIPKPSTFNLQLSTSKFLKKILEEYVTPILDHYSKKLDIKYKKLTIRKTKSKRGSCTHDQNISLNLNLVHLPTKYIKYVIIHEICHLKVKNHSKKFRALVEQFCPEYKTIKKDMRLLVIK